MVYKVVIFGNKSTTTQFIEYIHHQLIPIDLIVSVDKTKYEHSISGFNNVVEFAQSLSIPVLVVNDYSLCSLECKDFFSSNEFDLGISVGWQRLIPQAVLNRFRTGVFGFHGSPGHLPYGRGRSPLNWSVIKGHTRFLNNLFMYNEEADKGGIHSTKAFEINEFDTMESLQYKTVLVGLEQVAGLIKDYRNQSICLEPQRSNLSTWYPKRTVADGKISLLSSTREIYNLVRGVSRPFPGAFLYSADQKKLTIWEAVPFDAFIDTSKYLVGEIIATFGTQFIIKTVDGSILVKKYEYPGVVKKNILFH
ncbi:methionyl-tRNA formyltransferase [Paenibacillus sp. GCM10027626]|uniref:methionyl-tRNA formyltransferase n=1 Tax=Paenibacillus sp. GCM10027626 TaxID=3273411 RepID=UPI0036318D6E